MASNTSESPALGTDNVPVLTNDRFDEFVNSYKYVFVGFTHAMSPRWNHFKPIFEQIAKHLQKDDTQFAVVDIGKSYDLVQRLEIDGWNRGAPSLHLFQGVGHRTEYRGALRETEITECLRRHKSDLISNITQNNLETFRAQNDVVVVGYTGKGDHRRHALFNELARSFRNDLMFGMSWETDPEFAAAEGIVVPSIAVYKNFDDRKEVQWFSIDLDAMSQFIQDAGRHLILEFLPEMHDDLLAEGVPLGYILTDGTPISTELRAVVEAVAGAHKTRIHFGTWDNSQSAKLDQDLRLISPSYPCFAIREPIINNRYPLNNFAILLQEALPRFVSAFMDGDLKPSVRSAPVPIQTSPVIEVVTTTFEQIVMDPKKDVFIEFETKSCGPCKAIFPVLEKLAKLYGNDERWKDKVVIAKMDAEANDVPGEELRMFPTFRLYPADGYDKVDDETCGEDAIWVGFPDVDRSVEGFASCIQEYGMWHADLNLKGK